jgi:hypothetical protein
MNAKRSVAQGANPVRVCHLTSLLVQHVVIIDCMTFGILRWVWLTWQGVQPNFYENWKTGIRCCKGY